MSSSPQDDTNGHTNRMTEAPEAAIRALYGKTDPEPTDHGPTPDQA